MATALLLILVAAAAGHDLWTRRIPNRLNAAIALAGLAVAVAGGDPVPGLIGMAVGLILLLPAFAARWIGGGDVKLLAALGAWLGPLGTVWAASIGLAGGAVLAIAMAAAAGIAGQVARNLGIALATGTAPVVPRRDRLVVPLAVPLAVAAAVVHLGAP